MKKYIEYWESGLINKTDQRFSSKFLEKYGDLALYDEDLNKIYIIDHEYNHYVKIESISLIGIPDEPSTDHEYFAIHEGLFVSILVTHYNVVIKLK